MWFIEMLTTYMTIAMYGKRKWRVATCMKLRTGSDYGQTLRGEAFGPMKMQNCPKSVLLAFTLEAEVQRLSPPKEPRWQHF
jgi:hypothetical protein